MRIFLIWPGRKAGAEFGDLISALNKRPHEIVYWVGASEKETFKPKNTIFHSCNDAMAVIPAKGVDISEFPPISEDLINKLYKTESVVLTMMNRMFGGKSIDERKHLYYEMLRYWLGVFNKYKPEFIIFPNTPHFVFNYVIYELARLMNIEMIMFDDTRIPGRLLFYSDFRRGSDFLRARFQENKEKKFILDDLSTDIRKYYESRADKNYKKIPDYVKDLKKKYSTVQWLLFEPKIKESVKDLTVFKKAPRYFFNVFRRQGILAVKKPLLDFFRLVGNNLKKEYVGVQEKPDWSKKFIYFPLQKQPERTTSPQGDIFVDQILAIKILSASLPDDYLIYVKEHPLQWLDLGLNFPSFRYKGYYQRIAGIKNVKIIPINENSYDLIDRARVIAAVTGSAGWEAALRGKPAIIFGYVWYQDCPGVFKANDVKSCQNALKEIANGFKIDRQKIINYLKSFDEATIRGFIAATASRASGLTGQESMENIARLILKEMEKFGNY